MKRRKSYNWPNCFPVMRPSIPFPTLFSTDEVKHACHSCSMSFLILTLITREKRETQIEDGHWNWWFDFCYPDGDRETITRDPLVLTVVSFCHKNRKRQKVTLKNINNLQEYQEVTWRKQSETQNVLLFIPNPWTSSSFSFIFTHKLNERATKCSRENQGHLDTTASWDKEGFWVTMQRSYWTSKCILQ